MPKKTGQVALEIGVSSRRLYDWIAKREIPQPARDWSGEYAWGQTDVENARRALAKIKRGRKKARTT